MFRLNATDSFERHPDAGSGSVPRLRRSEGCAELDAPTCRAGLKFGDRPYGPVDSGGVRVGRGHSRNLE